MAEANIQELAWLGFDWDEGPLEGGPHAPYVQSSRTERYERVLSYLQLSGLTFECWLSRKDVQEMASAPHKRGPVYGTAEREHNRRVAAERAAAGRTPAIRLKAREIAERVEFTDVLAGVRRFDTGTAIGDVVLFRADGVWAYQLAVVADDIAMGIREVVRGADLLQSTAAQLLIYQALGEAPPRFLHVPLLNDSSGARMAKRKGSLTVHELARRGIRPERVTGLLAYTLGLLPERQAVTPWDLLGITGRDWPTGSDIAAYDLSAADLAWLDAG